MSYKKSNQCAAVQNVAADIRANIKMDVAQRAINRTNRSISLVNGSSLKKCKAFWGEVKNVLVGLSDVLGTATIFLKAYYGIKKAVMKMKVVAV